MKKTVKAYTFHQKFSIILGKGGEETGALVHIPATISFMLKSVVIISSLLLFCNLGIAQNSEKRYGANFGVNLAATSFIYFNEESFVKTIPNWQFSLNREFLNQKYYGVIASLGVNANSFNARRQISPNLQSIKQINLTYLSLEAGPIYKIPVKETLLFTGINLRASRVLSQNFNEFYGRTLGEADFGINFLLGSRFVSRSGKPYLLFNYYYGLVRLAKNFITTGNGESYKDYLRNKGIGMQVGFYF